jgi:hypothetical protein
MPRQIIVRLLALMLGTITLSNPVVASATVGEEHRTLRQALGTVQSTRPRKRPAMDREPLEDVWIIHFHRTISTTGEHLMRADGRIFHRLAFEKVVKSRKIVCQQIGVCDRSIELVAAARQQPGAKVFPGISAYFGKPVGPENPSHGQ